MADSDQLFVVSYDGLCLVFFFVKTQNFVVFFSGKHKLLFKGMSVQTRADCCFRSHQKVWFGSSAAFLEVVRAYHGRYRKCTSSSLNEMCF